MRRGPQRFAAVLSWPAVSRTYVHFTGLLLITAALACGSPATSVAPEPSATVTSVPSREAPREDEAPWTAGAVVYGVVPDLFGEPPLKAVTARIPELAAMGIDALWLSPVTATTDPDDYGYATTDYFAVREDFGTSQDMQQLVERAHAHDMRVLMDFVPNHTSEEHPWVHDPQRADWYDRGPDGRATHYFDWSHLLNLDYDNPSVLDAMTGAFTHWMRAYDVDGFRVDAAWGIRERSPHAWPEILEELRAVDPEVFMLAEASARDPYWFRRGFDAAYDWTEQVGEWAWKDVFEDVDRIGPRLDAALAGSSAPLHRVARFINNNDTGARFITRYGAPMQRVAAALLLTLPGLPVVFTGDEVGAEFEPYALHEPISWADPHALRPWYERLAELRESLPALRGNGFTPVPAAPASTYAYLRHGEDGGDAALVVLNFGDATDVRLSLPDTPEARVKPHQPWDALRQIEVPVRWHGPGQATVAMPATSAAILVPRAG